MAQLAGPLKSLHLSISYFPIQILVLPSDNPKAKKSSKIADPLLGKELLKHFRAPFLTPSHYFEVWLYVQNTLYFLDIVHDSLVIHMSHCNVICFHQNMDASQISFILLPPSGSGSIRGVLVTWVLSFQNQGTSAYHVGIRIWSAWSKNALVGKTSISISSTFRGCLELIMRSNVLFSV